jgi:hypothetical protein
VSVLIFTQCTNSSDSDIKLYKSDGIITGYDLRECVCCGGWFIDIADSTYRFYEVPKDSYIFFEVETYPIKVKLDWKKSPTPCMGDEIIVERIKKAN